MINVSFDNLEQIKEVYDPVIVEKATFFTIKQLTAKAATEVSSQIRDKSTGYNIKAKTIKDNLTPRLRKDNGVTEGLLIYFGARISLRHFSSQKGGEPPLGKGPRPRVKTKRGDRYGARYKIKNSDRNTVGKKAFWGRGRRGNIDGDGEWQIFQRIGADRLKIKKLTGPSVAQLAGGEEGIKGINKTMNEEANRLLVKNLDHFISKKTGTR